MTPQDSPTESNSSGAQRFVAGLADAGLRMVFVSPGSRNTPLTLALDASESIATEVVRDERSAGFAALGYAKATGIPTGVACTSGSAATHYFPAVVEADHSSTPLVVLSADRPVELRGTSAPQTMDQTNLYGGHVKAWVDIDVSDDSIRSTAQALVQTAVNGIPGPVHVNLPFAEPLTPTVIPDGLSVENHESDRESVPAPSPLPAIEGHRVLVIAGGGHGGSFPTALGRFVESLNAVLFADVQCRPASENAVDHFDLLVQAGALDRHPPDRIIRVGSLPTSKALSGWLAATDVDQTLVHRSRLSDPLGNATTTFTMSPHDFVSGRHDTHTAASGDQKFPQTWSSLDAAAAAAIEEVLPAEDLTEPGIAREILRSAAPNSAVFVGSSMPIRDLDAFGFARTDVHVIANRGVNGIDGSLSTALGMAASGVPTTALIGDIAALHDATAMAEIAARDLPLRIVVVNNDGGGIFSFLPQADSAAIEEATYERYWGTPHGLSLSAIAAGFGLTAVTADSTTDLASLLESLPSPALIETHTDRSRNVAIHQAVGDGVRARVEAL